MAKLSRDQVEWACQKRDAGWSTQRIATHLSVSAGAINYQCLKHGAFSPRQRRMETPKERTTYIGKDGRSFRTFTPDEDEQLVAYRCDGKTIGEIGRLMSRGLTSVRMRLKLLELREDLPA